jgi:hypothetical protein
MNPFRSHSTSPPLAVVVASGLILAGAASSAEFERHDTEGVVAGRVVDEGGRGVAGASVLVETESCCFSGDLTARTDDTGAFEVRGAPPGLVRVRALHPAFAPSDVIEVEVSSARDPVPLLIVLGRGARVTGHVSHRDGRPFTAGWVIVASSHPEGSHDVPRPLALDEDGAFEAEHAHTGRGRVYVLAPTPHAAPPFAAGVRTLSPIAVEPVEIREGDEAVIDVTLKDVIVSGRVTRGGEAAEGIRVTLSTGPGRSITLPGLPAPAVDTGPPALEATTRDDGSYELLVFGPGTARVTLTAVASGETFAARPLTVPDADLFTADFDLAEAAVSGVVVDADTGAPLPDVSLRLSTDGGSAAPGTLGRSGPDGTFAIAAEAGDYILSAERLGRVRVVREVSLGPEGVSDVRIEMGRGLSIVGRVVDSTGRPASGQVVRAEGSDGFELAVVGDDGRFRMEGLGAGPYALSVGSPLAGFALRRAVKPGVEPVRLVLRPAGQIALQVVASDDLPVAEAVASIVSVEDVPVRLPDWAAPPTSEEGQAELSAPPGQVVVSVRAQSGTGVGTATVSSGETVPLRIEITPLDPRETSGQ